MSHLSLFSSSSCRHQDGLTILHSRDRVSLLQPNLPNRVARVELCGTQELCECDLSFAKLAHLQQKTSKIVKVNTEWENRASFSSSNTGLFGSIGFKRAVAKVWDVKQGAYLVTASLRQKPFCSAHQATRDHTSLHGVGKILLYDPLPVIALKESANKFLALLMLLVSENHLGKSDFVGHCTQLTLAELPAATAGCPIHAQSHRA
jgi:hypothetical protein